MTTFRKLNSIEEVPDPSYISITTLHSEIVFRPTLRNYSGIFQLELSLNKLQIVRFLFRIGYHTIDSLPISLSRDFLGLMKLHLTK